MSNFETTPIFPAQDHPDVEQLLEYRDMMVNIVRRQGKGIRYARLGETARTRLGTEYMLPGAMTEWSIPGKDYRTHIIRDRCYSASFRPISKCAGRLLVLESDSVRVRRNSFDTIRNMYRFTWGEEVGIYEAEVLPIKIISGAQTDFEILSKSGIDGMKELMIIDQERTAELAEQDDTGYFRYINPWRQEEYAWNQVSAADFDMLLSRTDEFGRAVMAKLDRKVA